MTQFPHMLLNLLTGTIVPPKYLRESHAMSVVAGYKPVHL